MTRQPSLLWPSLFWLGMAAVLVGLGSWQIHRLHWKEGLIAQLHATMASPPTALPAKANSLKELEFHHVKFSGEYLNKAELYRHAIARDGKPGFHVITP
ncbi:MAG: SURF1 family protein, partial [Stellaceae bacterium]